MDAYRRGEQFIVQFDLPDHALGKATDAKPLLDAVMCLARQIDHCVARVGGPEISCLARSDDAFDVGDARAGGQVAAGRFRVSDEVRHPPEKRALHCCCCGCREMNAGICVSDVREEIAERCREDPSPGNERELAARGLVDADAVDPVEGRQRVGDTDGSLFDGEGRPQIGDQQIKNISLQSLQSKMAVFGLLDFVALSVQNDG